MQGTYWGRNSSGHANFGYRSNRLSGLAFDSSGNPIIQSPDGTTAATFSDTGIALAGTFSTTGALTPTAGVAAAGGFAVTPRCVHTGNAPPLAAADGTNATPVNTEIYFAECFIPANMTVTGVAIFNGSVASGNMKVGLYNSSGVLVATSASTAMSGTDTFQRVAFTATYAAVGPATYYVGLIVDNGTARINCHPIGNFAAGKKTGQVYATGFTALTIDGTFTADLGPIATLY